MLTVGTTRVRAFVLNASTPNGLGAIRSLGREGIPVTAVDRDARAAGLRSRYADALVLPDPSLHPQEVLEGLLEAGRKLPSKSVLFPCSDAYVLFISRYRSELAERFELCVPPERVLEGMVNKRKQYEEAARIGTPIARTFYPRDMNDVMDIRDLLDYPAFIKPYYSHLWHPVFGNKGFKVQDPHELEERFSQVFAAGLEALVQSIIQGPNTNHVKVCAYYARDGERRALFLTRKIRQNPVEFGVGTIMESFHDDELAALGTRFLEGIGYRGIGSIELKLDDRDGRYKMIELNPRLWAQNSQPTCAGINFPLTIYHDLTGSRTELRDYRDGIRWVDSLEDARAFWWHWQRGRTTFGDLARQWLSVDCHAYLAWDDPLPAVAHCHGGVGAARVLIELLRSGLGRAPEGGRGAPPSSSCQAHRQG